MKAAWVLMNLAGLALILVAALVIQHGNMVVILLVAGCLLSAVANIFKYYAYKKGKGHHPRVVG